MQKKLCSYTVIFDQLDHNRKGFISESDIANFFEPSNLRISQRDATNIIQKFDKNYDCVVDLKEFLNELKPKIPDINLLV